MRLLFTILILPAVVFAVPEKRFLLDSVLKLINTTTIVKDLQLMIDLVGSDPTEQACEQAGHKYLTGLLDHSVPLVCHSFQELVQHFNIAPTNATTAASRKRFLLDDILKLINTTTIVKDLQLMIDLVGSDPTEQACEQAGHKYLTGLLDHSVPLICHSFQELVHHFNIAPAVTTTAGSRKRFLLDDILKFINTTTIVKDLQLMIDLVGSDPTEQACEQAGHKYLTGLLDHSVPLICHSFQELVHHFNIAPAVTTTAASRKRFLLDDILRLINTTTIVKDLQLMIDLVGSDPTEQACEQAGHKYLTGLLDHSVPLICHSFQELVHHFNIAPAVTTTAASRKRFLLDDILRLINTTTIVKDLQLMIDLVGSDPTEQACEQAGHKYLTGLLDHSVPLICHSFQELVHHFNIAPAVTTTAASRKRFLLDDILRLINTTTIVKDLQLMIDLVGSDPTEQACEQAGHKYLTGLLDHSVPLICHSFQELVHHFNIAPAVTTTAASRKRFLLDDILRLINTTTIVKDLQLMIDLVGSDPTEQACEQAGHKYLTGLLDHSVPLICHSFQELVHHFNIAPAVTTSAASRKRFLLDDILRLINTTTIVKDLQLMIDLVGSDPTEQACEQAGHKYLTGLLDHSVPLICHSFQELVHHFNIAPAVTTTAASRKRFLLDDILRLINTTTIVKDLQLMIDLVGSDPTEQACEQAGHKYLTGLLDHSVPLICHSFQELVHHFNIAPAVSTTAASRKRFLLDDILKFINTTTIVKDLQLMIDLVGSDPTEQACEQAGHKYLTGLLDHSVPLICHSFQELVHHFNIAPAVTTTAASRKRFLLDDILKFINTTTIVKDLQLMIDLVGSDPTEQACEQAGHKYLTGLLDHSVPLICHSFQELVHHFNIAPAVTTTAASRKRFLLDDILKFINTTTIVKDLQLMIDLVGSDPTEQACEQAGHKYLTGLLDHSVPLICHSFQELVHHFNIAPATTTVGPVKRFFLDKISKVYSSLRAYVYFPSN